ncbi:hypothetical protein ACFBZI_03490 [Moraxella sp. ZJ142]|uniref:hypothetical protein n=1 Tax=Moraxella marmotae TaxID=3344520 RepID=UPI0035D472C4
MVINPKIKIAQKSKNHKHDACGFFGALLAISLSSVLSGSDSSMDTYLYHLLAAWVYYAKLPPPPIVAKVINACKRFLTNRLKVKKKLTNNCQKSSQNLGIFRLLDTNDWQMIIFCNILHKNWTN